MSTQNNSKQFNANRIMILHALEQCMREGASYSDITISQICSHAHISKPTFYHYFDNKENVVLWISRFAVTTGVAQIGRTFTWFQGYYWTSLVQHRHRQVFCDKQNVDITSKMMHANSNYQRDQLKKTLADYHHVITNDELSFQIEALLSIEGIMARRWGVDKMTVTPRKHAELMASIVPHELFELLNRPALYYPPEQKQAFGLPHH